MGGIPTTTRLEIGNVDLSGRVEKVQVTNRSPGGFESLSLETSNYHPDLGETIRFFDKTYDKGIFLGVVSAVEPGSGCVKIEGGRTTALRKLPTKVFTGGSRVIDMIHYALTQCELVFDSSGSVVNLGLQLPEDTTDFKGQTPEAVFNYGADLGNYFNPPVSWWVWDDRGGMALYWRLIHPSPAFFAKLPSEQVRQRYELASAPTKVTVEWGNGNFREFPHPLAINKHPHVKVQVDKFVNANNNISTLNAADALASNLYERFKGVRDVAGSINFTCDDVLNAVSPIVSGGRNNNYPLWLARAGYFIDLEITEGPQAPYDQRVKFIAQCSYDFDAGTLSMGTGEVVGLDTSIQLMMQHWTNRPSLATTIASVSEPLVDQDTTKIFGPKSDGTGATTQGIPVFVKDKDGNLVYGGVIHPDLVADEGIEINFSCGDADVAGMKGMTRSIPGLLTDYIVYLGNDAGLVDDSITVKVTRENGAVVQNVIGTSKKTVGNIGGSQVLAKGEALFFTVMVPTSAANPTNINKATWFSIALHGKKRYPGLRI